MKSFIVGIGLSVCTVLTGCVEDSSIDPGELPTGIYKLHIDSRIDTCAPAKPVGDIGEMAVDVSDRGISAVTVELVGAPFFSPLIQRYLLDADEGYTSTIGRGIAAGSLCGGEASFITHREVVSATADHLVINEKTEWTVGKPCSGPSVVPEQSCRSDVDQHYDLVTVCERPCSVRAGTPAPGTFISPLSCLCPGDEGF